MKIKEIKYQISTKGYADIFCSDCTITVTSRPIYCDRGRWMVAVFSNKTLFAVDDADMFPRYYFKDQSLIEEMEAWMEIRQQKEIMHAAVKPQQNEKTHSQPMGTT